MPKRRITRRITRQITLLVEPLRVLLTASQPELHLPSLQAIASRGDALPGIPENAKSEQAIGSDAPAAGSADDAGSDADVLRCALFGLEVAGHPPPVAALHLMAAQGQGAATAPFYLRVDPVTLSVDRVSVLMSGCGFADLDAGERVDISSVITAALADLGLQVVSPSGDGWILALARELPFDFPALSAALGADCADVLPDPMPDNGETLAWKRIINEVQMALHACPVNQQRRQSGRREINSVWFWGGGKPSVPSRTCRIGSVYSDHPLSRGLAVLQGCALDGLAGVRTPHVLDFPQGPLDILVDWDGSRISAEQDLLELEQLAQGLLEIVRREDLELRLIDGNGSGWRFSRRCARRFWRRRAALVAAPRQGFSI